MAFADEHPEAGAWGGVTELPDGRIDPSCCQSRPSLFWSMMFTAGLGRLAPKGAPRDTSLSGDVPVLTGAYMMVPKPVWERLGGFDESFFMFAEELDLCERIRRLGLPLLMTGRSRIIHLGGSGNSLSPNRIMQLTRGQIHYAHKHATAMGSFLARINIWMFAATRFFGSFLLKPLIGTTKARALREAFYPILRYPHRWWRGWREPANQASAHTMQLGRPS